MAKNAKYYAKIAGTWEQQYLQTTALQTTYVDPETGFFSGVSNVSAALDRIQSKYGTANGLATLDENVKIPVSQLPSSVIGGMRFKGTTSLSTGKTVDDLVNAGLFQEGEYFIVTDTGDLSQGTTYVATIEGPGDEADTLLATGDAEFPITLEAGDWIIVTETADGENNTVKLAILNNTYKDASSSAKGVVKLSDYTDGGGWQALDGTGVVTEQQLAWALSDNFGTTAGTVAEGNHTHAIYLQKAGGTMTGDLTIGDGDASGATEIIMNAVDSDATGLGSESNAITFKYLPTGESLAQKNLFSDSVGVLKWGSDVLMHNNNWDLYVPEIFTSTDTPTGGKNGDVWIEYSAIA